MDHGRQGRTALMLAARTGHEPIVRFLVEHGEAPGFVLATARRGARCGDERRSGVLKRERH